MRVLTINCGSSSLKFDVFDADPEHPAAVARVAHGAIERIGHGAASTVTFDGRSSERVPLGDHAHAFAEALKLLTAAGLDRQVDAVGHRVVHGGAGLRTPALLDDTVLRAIEAARDLAPLHDGPAVRAITAARAHYGGGMPMVATFDTAFFAALPEAAATYALPQTLSARLGIRRYGFHGLAHRYMVERFRTLRPALAQPRLITLQLGSGSSATASLDGQPLDTSMGFTPLEGLIMGTRSGDVDPALPLFLVEQGGLSFAEVDSLLNTESGLLGLSGLSSDMRDLIGAATVGHRGAGLAIEAFCHRARKYVGAYLAVLHGADAIVFGGGIGENSPEVRESICGDLEWAGFALDLEANRSAVGVEGRVGLEASGHEVWVMHVDEAVIIARDVLEALTPRSTYVGPKD